MPLAETRADAECSLWVMAVLGILVGVVAGFGAWIFRLLIGVVHNFLFLGEFQLYYDANIHTPAGPWGIGIILVPVIGALVVTFLVNTFAPEAKGHGVPEVMDAIHYKDGHIRPQVALVKSLASAISIGSGGSVGREGPIIQIGAAFGSTLGALTRLPPRQKIILVAAGAGGGIAATFNAPLGGVLFAIELLLLSVNARTLLPVALGTMTATYFGRWLLTTTPSFDVPDLALPDFHLVQGWALLLFVPLGVVMGLVCLAFVRGIYWAEDRFDALIRNPYLRHSLGMLAVGVMIWLMLRYAGQYYIEGVGYAAIMDILQGLLSDPWFLLLLFALKFVATCLTLGSGGSGGVFSPSLFMGAAVGAAFGIGCHALFPGLAVGVPVFALAGMAAAVGGTTGAVLTATVMVFEMSLDYRAILPILITTVIAYGLRKRFSPDSIYTLKLTRRGHVVPEGLQAAFDDSRRVRDIMSAAYRVARADAPGEPGKGVILAERDGLVLGLVPSIAAHSGRPLAEMLSTRLLFVPPDAPVLATLREMHREGAEHAVVMKAPDGRRAADVVGILGPSEIAAAAGRSSRLL